MSKQYVKWKKSIHRDGPTYDVLNEAKASEIPLLEEELIKNIGYYESLLLGEMASKKAIPYLKEAIKKNESEKYVYMKALWMIEGLDAHLKGIVDYISDSYNSIYDRERAIWLLLRIREHIIYQALESFLYDESFNIRFSSAKVYSYNSKKKTADQTILNNIRQYNKNKLNKLAGILRNKIGDK